jgi:ribonuclease G
VKEVVRQLRLRDIGGIIVIDFIDMANPKNRQAVEDALRTELERDRTKTYVVEISPLGLVEMTRQNVTEGPREILTRKCPTCGGDGVVISEQSAAIDLERRLRALARNSRVQAYRVEVNSKVASLLIGPGASRLQEIEAASRRRFFLVPKDDVHLDHFLVLEQGKLETVAPDAPFREGATLELQPVEVGLHDPRAAVAKLDGYDVVIANAARLVGKKVKAKVQRVLPGIAYATVVSAAKDGAAPITAEGEAEKPTRRPAAAKTEGAEAETEIVEVAEDGAEGEPKKRTRRGSRGGRRRKKAPTIHVPGAEASDNGDVPELVAAPTSEPVEEVVDAQPVQSNDGAEVTAEGEAPKKRKTRRGSRGGRNRRKKPAAAAPAETSESG